MHPIIALWSHPRSMSTATERIMRERGDLTCMHEPFMYDYYIHRKVRQMPHFDAEEGRPVSYDEVRDQIMEAALSGPVFFKDMSYYVIPHILDDEPFMNRLTNCFLIRDPVASITSYFKLDADVTNHEIGLEAQAHHHTALLERGGDAPIVIQAEDIRADTPMVLNKLWERIGLPPADHAFDWQSKKPADWQQVAGWHGEVAKSTGIRPLTADEIAKQRATFDTMSKTHPKMTTYLETHRPHYETLKAAALQF